MGDSEVSLLKSTTIRKLSQFDICLSNNLGSQNDWLCFFSHIKRLIHKNQNQNVETMEKSFIFESISNLFLTELIFI